MKAVVINTQESPNKWWAVQDRKMRNIANKSKYSSEEQIRVERMRMALTNCYHGEFYDPSYGVKGVSIKVGKAQIVNRKDLRSLEADWTKAGITKKASAQGVIYRIPKV